MPAWRPPPPPPHRYKGGGSPGSCRVYRARPPSPRSGGSGPSGPAARGRGRGSPALSCGLLERRDVALGQSELARLEESPHDLSAPGLRKTWLEIDFFRRDRGAKPAAREGEQLPPELGCRLSAVLQGDEGLHDFQGYGIWLANDPGLRHRGMLHENALDLEGADQVAGSLDDVVRATDEPEIAVAIASGEIAREVPAAHEALPVARLLAPVTAEHGGPPRTQRQLPLNVCILDDVDAVLSDTANDGRIDPGQRPAHRAGADVHRGEVGDHDPAGLGLPPVVMERAAEGIPSPHDGFGVQGLAHRRGKPERAEVVLPGEVGSGLHQH